MNEFENSIRQAMRENTQAPDEAFAARVAMRIDAGERRRAIGLAIASLVAVAMIGALAIGFADLAPLLVGLAPRRLLELPPDMAIVLAVAVPVVGFFMLAALLGPLALRRRY